MYCGRPTGVNGHSARVVELPAGEYRDGGFDARFAPGMTERSTSEAQRWRKKRWFWLLSLILVLVALAVAEKVVRWTATMTSLPTGRAEWIWASIAEGQAEPEAFYLVRDFELDFTVEQARLLVLADEEYVAILNGVQIGGGRYSGEGLVDAYSVGGFLERGRNRLVIEARSSRGNGGLLLNLEVQGAGDSLTVVSDGAWQVLRHQVRSLGRAGEEIQDGVEPMVWGLPPIGRWPLPTMVRPRPTIPELLVGGEPRRAVRARQGGGNRVWKRLDRDTAPDRRFGPWVTFDWGRSVTGYLALEYPIEESPVALIYVGDELPDPAVSRPTAVLVGLEGGWLWSDTLPRRFRYATVLVRGSVTGAMVVPTDPKKSAALIPAEEGSNGVFGLQSKILRTPLENEFRRELHGLASAAGREDL